MIRVIDVSFAGAWLLPDEGSKAAEQVVKSVLEGKLTMAIPHLWEYEMANLLLVAHRRGRLTEPELFEAHDLVATLPRTRYEHGELLSQQRTARLGLRFGLSGYDATYLELADRLQAPLHTQDGALARAADQLGLLA